MFVGDSSRVITTCYSFKLSLSSILLKKNILQIFSPAHITSYLFLSLSEGSLLSAGCFLAQGDYDKARALLVIAHGQYHSEMRIKEARTPSVTTLTNLSGGVLGTFMEEEGDEEPSPMRDQFADNSMQLMMTADMYEKEVFGEEIFSKWDFGKQKEYSCREQVMPALVSEDHSKKYSASSVYVKQGHISNYVYMCVLCVLG